MFTQECIDVGAREGQEGSTEDAWEIVKILPETNRRVVNYMINFLRVSIKIKLYYKLLIIYICYMNYILILFYLYIV